MKYPSFMLSHSMIQIIRILAACSLFLLASCHKSPAESDPPKPSSIPDQAAESPEPVPEPDAQKTDSPQNPDPSVNLEAQIEDEVDKAAEEKQPELPNDEKLPDESDAPSATNEEAEPLNGISPIDIPGNTQQALDEFNQMMEKLSSPGATPEDFSDYLIKITETAPNPDLAIRFIQELEYRRLSDDVSYLKELDKKYYQAIAAHPILNSKPRKLIPNTDISGIKRLGGGSSLVYRLTKDKDTIAAFKPFQKRFQSNYRSEIAAYRLCPMMKCGFDIPENVPVYMDYNDFSNLYSRNPKNPKIEFNEIIPTKLPDGTYRVYGTFKRWIPEFADYPIEFGDIWKPWLNPGEIDTVQKLSEIRLQDINFAKRHARGERFAQKLAPHLQNVDMVKFARQISNLIVFDFLINNWDRFSGAKDLYGINCQIAHGRFMSIDNGASFAKTPNAKPLKHLKEIQRFSRLTYNAIKSFDKDKLLNYLFPDATDFEKLKFETFWKSRQKYLDYVQNCIDKNGEKETFFFE